MIAEKSKKQQENEMSLSEILAAKVIITVMAALEKKEVPITLPLINAMADTKQNLILEFDSLLKALTVSFPTQSDIEFLKDQFAGLSETKTTGGKEKC